MRIEGHGMLPVIPASADQNDQAGRQQRRITTWPSRTRTQSEKPAQAPALGSKRRRNSPARSTEGKRAMHGPLKQEEENLPAKAVRFDMRPRHADTDPGPCDAAPWPWGAVETSSNAVVPHSQADPRSITDALLFSIDHIGIEPPGENTPVAILDEIRHKNLAPPLVAEVVRHLIVTLGQRWAGGNGAGTRETERERIADIFHGLNETFASLPESPDKLQTAITIAGQMSAPALLAVLLHPVPTDSPQSRKIHAFVGALHDYATRLDDPDRNRLLGALAGTITVAASTEDIGRRWRHLHACRMQVGLPTAEVFGTLARTSARLPVTPSYDSRLGALVAESATPGIDALALVCTEILASLDGSATALHSAAPGTFTRHDRIAMIVDHLPALAPGSLVAVCTAAFRQFPAIEPASRLSLLKKIGAASLRMESPQRIRLASVMTAAILMLAPEDRLQAFHLVRAMTHRCPASERIDAVLCLIDVMRHLPPGPVSVLGLYNMLCTDLCALPAAHRARALPILATAIPELAPGSARLCAFNDVLSLVAADPDTPFATHRMLLGALNTLPPDIHVMSSFVRIGQLGAALSCEKRQALLEAMIDWVCRDLPDPTAMYEYMQQIQACTGPESERAVLSEVMSLRLTHMAHCLHAGVAANRDQTVQVAEFIGLLSAARALPDASRRALVGQLVHFLNAARVAEVAYLPQLDSILAALLSRARAS